MMTPTNRNIYLMTVKYDITFPLLTLAGLEHLSKTDSGRMPYESLSLMFIEHLPLQN